MKIINPNEIGSKISTLIAESEEKFFAITPYIDISEWKKILINLENALKRGVKIEFFFREIKERDYQKLKKLGIELNEIRGLHTKLYLNEKEAIISSMNLYEYSDLHSIDIALHFDKSVDYNKVYDYFNKYISSKKSHEKFVSKAMEERLLVLHEYLSDRFSDARINSTKTYLFSKNLIPIFHVFIDDLSIGLKYPSKNPKIDEINEIGELIEKASIVDLTRSNYNTSEETLYYIWEINIGNRSNLEIANIISDLRNIETTPNA